jgi:hypothetical protein
MLVELIDVPNVNQTSCSVFVRLCCVVFADLMLVFPTVTVLFVCSVVAYHDMQHVLI